MSPCIKRRTREAIVAVMLYAVLEYHIESEV